MHYKILGPLRVCDGERNLTPSARKPAILLANLLLKSPQGATIEQLQDEIWGASPPSRASAAVHVHVSRLRKLWGGSESPLQTSTSGYVMHIRSGELDLHEFERHVHSARCLYRSENYGEAVESFRAALGVYRGPALDELRESPAVRNFSTRFEEHRLETVELMIECELTLGRHRELVGWLYALTAEYPLRETFHRYLMIALYRSERQGDALKAYRSARAILRDELGLEPGRALRELQRAILAADCQLELRAVVRR
ncbi:AfsR/SARP family transcriptional regulator [Frankia sp. AgPm24]|uniref:AfsR/SARP family transcriptional regulator n=1 Tax=Frankia umida TaxID=573489 RepID=A0ABT0K4X1_9ACTN|nr:MULTISPECIES: AfsR/SARP family transcriptional regulator [Frankia]MCK9878529.1 AfsR/SARP family transcriptional regulator [Frankia umida]MCK9925374.1 AfsR/SARP family transcriptional regulator [Frankia sp. AgPm24]